MTLPLTLLRNSVTHCRRYRREEDAWLLSMEESAEDNQVPVPQDADGAEGDEAPSMVAGDEAVVEEATTLQTRVG